MQKPTQPPTVEEARAAVRCLLRFVGEDPSRDGLLETPKRVTKALSELTAGYNADIPGIVKVFADTSDEMVILKGISFTSLCEHHMLPFSGAATVAYLPDGKVIGISKLARIVEAFAKRLQVQERLTHEVADALMANLDPLGVGVLVSASHSCMGCRGVRQPGAVMITSALRGVFFKKGSTREEFLRLAGA